MVRSDEVRYTVLGQLNVVLKSVSIRANWNKPLLTEFRIGSRGTICPELKIDGYDDIILLHQWMIAITQHDVTAYAQIEIQYGRLLICIFDPKCFLVHNSWQSFRPQWGSSRRVSIFTVAIETAWAPVAKLASTQIYRQASRSGPEVQNRSSSDWNK